MPELPEVETVRRGLAAHTAGLQLTGVRGAPVTMRRPLRPGHIRERLAGRTLVEPGRRGKYLLLRVEGGGALLIHLGMSGRLLLTTPETPGVRHTHLTLEMGNGRELRLIDPRRFGLAVWLEEAEIATDPALARLGPEPLAPEIDRLLPPRLKAHRAPLKSLLLDQTVVAGAGNIYATEALWRAGIRPTRRGDRTSAARLARLARELRAVLLEAVEQGGTTLRDFAGPDGNAGYFEVRLQAYGRAGRPCPRCGAVLGSTRIAGRATVWCTACQR